MESHNCDAIIVTCIDFRFQEYINNWISENLPPKNHDRVALAGGVKNLDAILEQVEIAKRLHHIHKAILINHENCGAYGEMGTPEKHSEDLKNAALKIKEQFLDLEVETYYLHLDGIFEKIPLS